MKYLILATIALLTLACEQQPWPRNGDLVRLKSGGPTMTVGGEHFGEFRCDWADAEGRRQSGWYPPESLVAVDGGQ